MRFSNRSTAGSLLAAAVAKLSPDRPLVAALPRGGVPVGFEVARRLGCDLDVLCVKKIGVPFQPELAMGAVAEGGVVIRNADVLQATRIDDDTFDESAASSVIELEAQLRTYRKAAPEIDPEGRTVIITDDGLATGSTAIAAIAASRARGARQVWVAVPVAPGDTVRLVEEEADRVVVLQRPVRFVAVGAWYGDFSQVSTGEARELLRRSRIADGGAGGTSAR